MNARAAESALPISPEAPESILRLFLAFAAPLLLTNLLQPLFGIVSAIFVGRWLGLAAFAAATVAIPIVNFIVTLLSGLVSGASILAGHEYGAGNQRGLETVTHTAMITVCVASIIAAAIGVPGARLLLQMFSSTTDLSPDAVIFTQVSLFALPVTLLGLLLSSLLRAIGDSKAASLATVAGGTVGVALMGVLITGTPLIPPLGIVSGPVASTVVNALSLVALVAYLRITNSPLAPAKTLAPWRITRASLASMLRIGIPTSLQSVAVTLSQVAVIFIVNRYGAHATAAYGAVSLVMGFAEIPAVTIGVAISIMVSHAVGAGDRNRVTALTRFGMKFTLLTIVVLLGLILIFARPLLTVFMTDVEAIEIARQMCFIVAWSYVMLAALVLLCGVLRADGDPSVPSLISILSIWGVEVPLALGLSHYVGLWGVWISSPIAITLAVAVLGLRYLRRYSRAR